MTEFATKEMIKERLWQYAAEKWHIDDLNKKFDPFIDLMFGGLSHEVEKIYHTIQESHHQVFNHLTDVLLPEHYNQPSPAHAILSVRPESYTSINELNTFFDDDKDKFSYSPAGRFDLIPAEVVYMAIGKELFSITDKFKKESRFSFQIGKELPLNTVFIGIKTGSEFDQERSIFNLYFHHIDLLNLPPYDYLPLVQLAHNDQLLKIERFQLPNVKDNVFKEQMSSLGLDSDIDRQVFKYYQSRFIQFDLRNVNLSHLLPAQLQQYLPASTADIMKNEKCIWIKMELPEVWVPYLKSIVCMLNSIPVINRKLTEKEDTHADPKVILQLEDKNQHFLTLHSLQSGDRPYTVLNEESQDTENSCPGSFQIVSGGVQTMDSRSVSTMIHHILDIVEESGQLDQSPSKAYEAIQYLNQNNPYTAPGRTLIIHNKPNTTSYTLQYWTTPSFVGQIPKKKELNTDATGIKEKTGFLVTDPIGGKPVPSMGQRLKKLRYSLISRDRICTEEDIKSFILSQLYEFEVNDILLNPIVVKNNGTGLSRAWSVYIDCTDTYKSNAKFIFLIKETEQLLNEKSTGLIPILLKY